MNNHGGTKYTGEASRLIPLTLWPHYHLYPTVYRLRHFVFHADSNGFHRCIRRVGKKILISETDYFEWVEEVNQREGQLHER